MATKSELMKFIKSIEISINGRFLKVKDEEKIKKNIIEFLCNKQFKGMFLDEDGKPMQRRKLEGQIASEVIKDFKKGFNGFKEFVEGLPENG